MINFITIINVLLWMSVGFCPSNLNDKIASEPVISNFEPGDTDFYLDENISDGPYIFFDKKTIVAKWIENDSLVSEIINKKNYSIVKAKFKVFPDLAALTKKQFKNPDYKQEYQGIEKFIAISDVHGQYNLFVDLLAVNNVIDANGNWIFGNGHLVINGDIFDRGENVTELLWLVYQLELQAKENLGNVHFLLGNHEVMVMEKDLRYIHEKYARVAQLMDTTYDYLYSDNTFLGRWLRSKPIVITIDNILITHAGISPQFIDYKLTPSKANKLFQKEIIGQEWDKVKTDSVLVLLDGNNGPLWYRGYFTNEFTEAQLDNILKYFKKDHIIVGHTSLKGITPFFNGKVYGIDSSIKEGEKGEVLIFENGNFYKGNLTGERLNL